MEVKTLFNTRAKRNSGELSAYKLKKYKELSIHSCMIGIAWIFKGGKGDWTLL